MRTKKFFKLFLSLRKFFPFLIIFFASLLASRELFMAGFFTMHDDLQVGRLYEMNLCFKDGQFPCRWVPDMGYSYGYPLFNYYPPFPYYFGQIFLLFGLSFIDSVKALFISGFFVSGILMFLFARKLWGNWGGLLSSILYLWAPYHSVDVYVRGAMNEFWALSFLPGIYLGAYKIIETKKANLAGIASLSLFSGLLLLSHNLMAFIFIPTVVVFSLLSIWLKKENLKEKTLTLFLASTWGVGLAAFFTLPVLAEKNFVHVETMLMGYFNYLAHFVPIGQMLFSRFWGYGSSSWLQNTGMPFQVGFPHWPLAILAFLLLVLFFFKKKVAKEIFFLSLFFIGLFFLALFLIHPRSVFIWQALPLLAYLQFPWRFLTLVIFAVSVLGGGIVYLFKDERLKFSLSFFLIVVAISLNFSFFVPEKIIQITDQEKLFSEVGLRKLQTDAIFDYLPKKAKAPPSEPAPKEPTVEEGAASFSDIVKGTDWYNFKVKAEKDSKIQLPIYDFPRWKVWMDGKPTKIANDNFLGLITIEVPSGNHEVRAKLTSTPIRLLGNFLSLVSWLLLFFFIAKSLVFLKNGKKNFLAANLK